MSKVSTIAIIDEQPAEVFRQLCLKNGGMRFKPAPKREVRSTAGPEGNHISDPLAETELVRRAEERLEAPATPIDDEDGEASSLDFSLTIRRHSTPDTQMTSYRPHRRPSSSTNRSDGSMSRHGPHWMSKV
jgi:hypothetical protein